MIYYRDLGLSGKQPSAKNTGLGNQFFQIAATTSLALDNNDTAMFPTWEYNEFLNGITTDDVSLFKISCEYKEPCFNYHKIPYFKNMNLNGYYQSEKYFLNHVNVIRKIFTLKSEFEENLKSKWSKFLNNSVSIHVRRGDYLSKQNYHPCPSVEYYINALDIIKNIFTINNVLVFSDDIPWCKNAFKNDSFIYVENQLDYEDLFLMSYCNHNIISNSSFSWWASWLNKNENKIVYAPKMWFGTIANINTIDLYCDFMKIM